MANDVDYGLSNKKEKRDIRYIGREFSTIRANLLEFAKTYYPTAYNDFNESSPGMMFVEMAAYVGDTLSFYIDTQYRETLLHAASEFKDHYPEGSQHKGASEEIWNDRETFNELNDKFVSDIEMISLSAELEDSEMLNDAFKVMSANCGACHKKFRN